MVGSSGGGYGALLAGTATTAPRCVATLSGISDPAAHLAWISARRGGPTYRWWGRALGGEDPASVKRVAPAINAADLKSPLLLLHGEGDTVVASEQAERLAKALKAAGKPVEFIPLAGDDHWLSLGATRQQTLQAIVAFLEHHNPPK